MDSMIYTARQLQLLQKNNGQVVLPYRARLTPLAADWVRAERIAIGYADDGVQKATGGAIEAANLKQIDQTAASATGASAAGVSHGFVWWCDGPCGAAKAALGGLAREHAVRALEESGDARQMPVVIKKVAGQVKNGEAAGAILVVSTGAAAMLYANRCPSLRAVLGTCIDAVEQGMRQIAANVLVIEHPYQTLMQMRNLMSRFVRGQGALNEDVKRALLELSRCG